MTTATNNTTAGEVLLWKPSNVADTNMDKFRRYVNEKYTLELANYEDLYHWSVTNIADFWGSVWEYTDIIHSVKHHTVVDEKANITTVPEWFQGARLNFAQNLLRFNDDRVAFISVAEGNKTRKITYAELNLEVRRLAAALRKAGLKEGDRVCAFIPNSIHAVIAMLATASIGGIYSTTAPDFGTTAVLERFDQLSPKFLFTANAVIYRGTRHNLLTKVKTIAEGLSHTLQQTIVFNFLDNEDGQPVNVSDIPNCSTYDDFIRGALGDDGIDNPPPHEFAQLPFNHPLYILFTSGTTGKPKCLVHSAGGTLIQHKKEHVFHGDLKHDDVIFFYTTTGWMMWHWLISAISVGSTVVLYDGSPFHPTPRVLFDLVDEHQITVFGTSAKYLASLEDVGEKPGKTHKLTSLRAILSTGSPLKPESFEYVYREIKQDVLLGSISGGTDIISCFAGSNPTLPVYRGEIQSRNLGMRVESFDDFGKPVYGQTGELVCTAPFPSMPIYFWTSENNVEERREKYVRSYFDKFPGVWSHGDYLVINPRTGGLVMHGRSDATLNPNGVRFGSAEIYNLVETLPEISDSLVVGQQQGCNERVLLFVKMNEGHHFDAALEKRLRQIIRTALSPRHVPEIIMEVADIPYTLNGKKVEVAIKKILRGEEVQNKSALANPESLDIYVDIAKQLGVGGATSTTAIN